MIITVQYDECEGLQNFFFAFHCITAVSLISTIIIITAFFCVFPINYGTFI